MSIVANRPRVFVGTSINAGDVERGKAAALAQVLWDRKFLPVMPFTYQSFFETEGREYQGIRLQLLSDCQSAIWVGDATPEEVELMALKAIPTRRVPDESKNHPSAT